MAARSPGALPLPLVVAAVAAVAALVYWTLPSSRGDGIRGGGIRGGGDDEGDERTNVAAAGDDRAEDEGGNDDGNHDRNDTNNGNGDDNDGDNDNGLTTEATRRGGRAPTATGPSRDCTAAEEEEGYRLLDAPERRPSACDDAADGQRMGWATTIEPPTTRVVARAFAEMMLEEDDEEEVAASTLDDENVTVTPAVVSENETGATGGFGDATLAKTGRRHVLVSVVSSEEEGGVGDGGTAPTRAGDTGKDSPLISLRNDNINIDNYGAKKREPWRQRSRRSRSAITFHAPRSGSTRMLRKVIKAEEEEHIETPNEGADYTNVASYWKAVEAKRATGVAGPPLGAKR